MSLDVYLTLENHAGAKGSGIFVREDGATKEITRQEWDAAFPGREPVIATIEEGDDNCVYSANITHNLNKMAEEAGIYKYLWRPDELGITRANELIQPLRAGLSRLLDNRTHFEQFNPKNGWGDYAGLVNFTDRYLKACERYPGATVGVSR